MRTDSRIGKTLETSMLAALNRKIYCEQRRDERPGKMSELDYRETCKECVDACAKLFAYYASKNESGGLQ